MALIDMLYNHSYVILRKTRTGDGQGGWGETWSTVATIAGRMRPASAAERTAADQRQALVSHVLYCGPDTNIARGDRVTGQERLWNVIAIREPSHAGHHLEVDCAETQLEGES
jgi:SPP1 family predicted phage head-tail adaptor